MFFVIVLRMVVNYQQKKLQSFINSWEEKIFDYLSSDTSPNEIISGIPRRNYFYLLDYIKIHLQTLKDEDYDKISALVTKTKVHDFLIYKLKRNNVRKNIKASYYLGLVKSERAKELFINKLETSNDHLFSNCAIGLAKIKAVEVIDKLFSESAKHKEISYDTLLTILLEFGENVCPILQKQLHKKILHDYRIIIIRTFGYYKYYSGGPEILSALIYSEDKNLVIESIKALGKIKYKEGLPALKRYIENKDPEIRAETIKTIGEIGDTFFEDRIFERIKDDNWQVQYNAAEALYNLSESGKKKLEGLAYSLEYASHSSVARMIISEKYLRSI
jgi:HEAT repeat protein